MIASSKASKTPAWPRVLACLLLGLTLAELVLGMFVYRSHVDDDDWDAVRERVEAAAAEGPVLLATSWLSPSARMQLRPMRAWSSIAPPDLRTFSRFFVVGLNEAWSAELEHDREDVRPAELVASERLGALTLHTYEQPMASHLVASLLEPTNELRVGDDHGPCKNSGDTWTCKAGRVQLRAVEIDYRPRRCLAVTADDGTVIRIVRDDVELGNVLRGHVGFDDFNQRLRSDAPVEVSVAVDGTIVGRWLVSDVQGWWPFAVATPAGRHELTITMLVSVRGTWQTRGYQPNSAHEPCIEVRAVQEPS